MECRLEVVGERKQRYYLEGMRLSTAEGHKADVSKGLGPQDLQTQNGSTWSH
jgi:hypothetical protein